MSRKTAAAYRKVLELFKQHYAGDFVPERIMTDFEMAIRKAAKQVYGYRIETTGCYFHYSQVN